jgi:uncharacterized protein YuzE
MDVCRVVCMPVKISYDKEFDNLHIYREGERSVQSIKMFDIFVVDIDFDAGKVVGLEIMNASKILKVPKEELAKVSEARLSTVSKEYFFGINYVIILTNKNKIEGQLMVPQPMKSKA